MSNNLFSNKKFVALALIIFCIISDQISKWFVLEKVIKTTIPNNTLGPQSFFDWLTSTIRLPFISVELLPFFNFTMVWNEGISFGLLQSGNPWPLIVISVIISVFFAIWIFRSHKWIEVIPLSMVIGGAIGNIIDRLHFGAVADFLDFHINGWHYPSFNLADSFITVGIVILVGYSLFFDHSDKKDS